MISHRFLTSLTRRLGACTSLQSYFPAAAAAAAASVAATTTTKTHLRQSFAYFSSEPPPPPSQTASPGGPPGRDGNREEFRLQHPRRSFNNNGGGGRGPQQRGGGGWGGRGGGGRFGRENPYQPRDMNKEYVATSGTLSKERPHMIAVFPGDYGDDQSFFDDQYEYEEERSRQDEEDNSAEQQKLKEFLKKKDAYETAQKERWIENAKPKDWPTVIDQRGRSYGRGSRNTAHARVWISPGLGEVVVNQKHFCEYFDNIADREHVLAPFVATETCGKFDVQCTVQGGGLTGQAGAIRLGVARALNAFNPDLYRPPLKFLGYLTRDPRYTEMKVVGRVKARKRPQWVKR